MDTVSMDVDGVAGEGRGIAGRAGDAGVHGKGLVSGLEATLGLVGHPDVRAALASFTDEVREPALALHGLVSAVGDSISNVAGVGRESDNEGARDVRLHTDAVETVAGALRRDVNAPV